MAKKVIYQFVDDLDQTPYEEGEGETISFSLDGKDYEIDLNDKNATKLRSHLNRYVEAGTKVSKSTKDKGSASSAGKRTDLAEVRAWAKSNGHALSDRGRIPGAILDAYDAAN
ncbi:MAG: histone-like nucleoid-structuring protein Lsr2 [Pseudoclavibacter sp.]